MKRREFLAASCLVGLAPLGETALQARNVKRPNPEYYELRQYYLESKTKQKLLSDFLADAAIPAMNRIEIKPVGVFKILEEKSPNLYVLMPHKSLESVAAVSSLLMADSEYLSAGSSFLNAPKSDPAYKRFESSLLVAFENIPKLELPTKKESRVFQLRIYESHNAIRGKRKIEMFNAGGEIAIFRRRGLNPVFFGESLIGTRLPNLTYMLGFDDEEALKESWEKFRNDPKWKKLMADPYYEDTVSNITNILLRPVACSQI